MTDNPAKAPEPECPICFRDGCDGVECDPPPAVPAQVAEPMCLDESQSGYVCTLPENHEGHHLATVNGGHEIARWAAQPVSAPSPPNPNTCRYCKRDIRRNRLKQWETLSGSTSCTQSPYSPKAMLMEHEPMDQTACDGTFRCPICSKDTPHEHSGEEIAEHRAVSAPSPEPLDTCPMCEFEQKPCPGGAHAFALWEDGIRTVEDYAKMRALEPRLVPAEPVEQKGPTCSICGGLTFSSRFGMCTCLKNRTPAPYLVCEYCTRPIQMGAKGKYIHSRTLLVKCRKKGKEGASPTISGNSTIWSPASAPSPTCSVCGGSTFSSQVGRCVCLQNRIPVSAQFQEIPEDELAQRLIRNTKGWMQERITELESALATEREARKQEADALVGLLNEYESQRCQFSGDSLWTKHEDVEAVQKAREIVSALQPVSGSPERLEEP